MSALCIFCRSSSVSDLFVKKTEHGEYQIVKCAACLSGYVWPRPSRQEMDEYYRGLSYQHVASDALVNLDDEYYPDGRYDAKKIVGECKGLSKGSCFLDVGAGHGEFSRQASLDGFNVTACEPNLNSREEFYKLNNYYPDPCVIDESYADEKRGQCDVVLLSQVLEHISDPGNVIKCIHTLLRRDGIAAIAVPHFGSLLSILQQSDDMFISPPEHLNFFSKNGLIKAFNQVGFRLEKMNTVSKVPRGKIERTIAIPGLSQLAWALPYSLLKSAELVGRGMVINAYFRKTT